MLGPDQPVILHLLDIEPAKQALEGVKMELLDAAFPLLKGENRAARGSACAMRAHGWEWGSQRVCLTFALLRLHARRRDCCRPGGGLQGRRHRGHGASRSRPVYPGLGFGVWG